MHRQLDRVAHQPLEQVRDFRNHVGQLPYLRPQRLLPRKGEQLPGQTSGAIGVAADMLDIVIIAVARRVAHQYTVATPANRRQSSEASRLGTEYLRPLKHRWTPEQNKKQN